MKDSVLCLYCSALVPRTDYHDPEYLVEDDLTSIAIPFHRQMPVCTN